MSMHGNLNAKITESIFGVFYVMTEGDLPSGGNWKFFCTIALLLIDSLQVLRSMAVSKFMWTAYSISVMRSIDLVSLFFTAVQNVIPEWFFFSFSILLAVGAIANATYVMKLFRAGQVKILWPLKLLRFLVASIVTIFFTTVLEFGMYPVRCIDVAYTFSSVVHGEERPCDPWAMPEMAISIPTIIVAIAFILFSLLTTFLDFTINPLCRHPLAVCTGRLEFLWTLFKVAALLLVYMEAYISPTACAIILFLLSVFIFYYHCTVLPFHNKGVNLVRGGIYATAVVFCLANIVILHFPGNQPLQNWFLGAIPVAFVLGTFVVGFIYQSITRYLEILRGQWDEKMSLEMPGGRRGQRMRRNSVISEATAAGGMIQERSWHDLFFDVNWAVKRRFSSGNVAYLATRILLHRRDEEEMPFLMSLLTECLQDHPNSQDLSMYHILALRYVFKERNQAATQEKLSKLASSTVMLDRAYVLFALNKKTAQEGASESLGKGSISAVNLMEFDQRLNSADKGHRDCIDAMKEFWKRVAKNKRHGTKAYNAPEKAKKMTEELDKFTKAMYMAKQEYAWLIEKYPSSAALLLSYANFCDHVLNDAKKADSLRQQVMVMESYGREDDDDDEEKPNVIQDEGNLSNEGSGEPGHPIKGDDSKSWTTDSENYRSNMARYMQSWSHLIMARDADMLTGVNWRIRLAILFLVGLSVTAFVVTDFVLFNDVALKTIKDIEETGKFRELAATAPYMLRSQMIESQRLSESHDLQNRERQHHLEQYDSIKNELIEVTRQMQRDHYVTFSKITTKKIQDFYDDPTLEVNIPTSTGWEVTKQSFRHLGTDFARRVASAASASYEEHSNTNYRLSEISTEKQDISYVFENMIRYVLPAFDQAVVIYQQQMDDFGALTTMLTSVAAGLTSFVVLIIAIDVLRARSELLKRVHANRVSICLALQVPHHVAVKFYKYFQALELDMAIMDEEEQDMRTRIANSSEDGGDFCRGGSSLGAARPGLARRPSMSSMCSDRSRPTDFNAHTPRSQSVPRSFGRTHSRGSENLERVTSTYRRLAPPPASDMQATVEQEPEQQAPVQREMSAAELTADNLQMLIKMSPGFGMSDHPLSPISRIPAIPKQNQSSVTKIPKEKMSSPFGKKPAPLEEKLSSPFTDMDMRVDNDAKEDKNEKEDLKGSGVDEGENDLERNGDESDVERSGGAGAKGSERDEDEGDEEGSVGVDAKDPETNDHEASASSSSSSDDEEDMSEAAEPHKKQPAFMQFSRRKSPWENIVQEVMDDQKRRVKEAWLQEKGLTGVEDKSEDAAQAVPQREAARMRAKTKAGATKRSKKRADKQEEDSHSLDMVVFEKTHKFEPHKGLEDKKPASPLEIETVELKQEQEIAPVEEPGQNAVPEDTHDAVSYPALLSPTRSKILRFAQDGEMSSPAASERRSVFKGLLKFVPSASDESEDLSSPATGKVGEAWEAHQSKAASQEGEDEKESLELLEVSDEMQHALVKLQFVAQPWFNRWYVYLFTLGVLLALCIMFSLYPARLIPVITNMAPSVNRAAERQSLARGCITLSRELVLRDGLSRMTLGEISGTLHFFMHKYEEVDRAVRLGDKDYDIALGADHRSREHNDFMYMLGCPWREDPTDCSLPNNTYTRAAEDGLFNLQSVFLTSIKAVLDKYGSREDEYVNTYDLKRDNLEDASQFDQITMNQDAYDTLLSDPDLRFLDLMFAGDLHQGLDHIVSPLFEGETRQLLDKVHVEARLLFGVYIGFLLQVFYSALFLRTLHAARLEVLKAKEYAHTIPLHVLDGEQAATVKRFYMKNNGHDEETDQQLGEEE